jgi:hypothetical protein
VEGDLRRVLPVITEEDAGKDKDAGNCSPVLQIIRIALFFGSPAYYWFFSLKI